MNKEAMREKLAKALRLSLEELIASGKEVRWDSLLSRINGFYNPTWENKEKIYGGMANNILLSLIMACRDWTDVRFIGKRQAVKVSKSGKPIKYDEFRKSTWIYYPIFKSETDPKTGKKVDRLVSFGSAQVWNIEQTSLREEGVIPKECFEKKQTDKEPFGAIMEYARKTGATIKDHIGVPHYDPMNDSIGIPPFDMFHNSFGHAESLAHELIHWTGKAGRLDRITDGQHRDDSYSFEELVANIGACFLLDKLGFKLGESEIERQSMYLRNWLKPLKDNANLLVDACQKATEALRYLDSCVTMTEASENESQEASLY